MNCVETLVQEHDNILKMLDVVHAASLRVLAGAPVEVDDFKKMVDFIRLYADKTHHGKEEDYLFKAMVSELGAMGDNLIRHGMLVEHDLGRLYVSELDTALDAYRGNPTDEARLAILVAAGSYEQLLRRHIHKENEVIFPFGEKNLPAEQLAWVERQMCDFEDTPENAAQREHQLSVLAELAGKYSEPK